MGEIIDNSIFYLYITTTIIPKLCQTDMNVHNVLSEAITLTSALIQRSFSGRYDGADRLSRRLVLGNVRMRWSNSAMMAHLRGDPDSGVNFLFFLAWIGDNSSETDGSHQPR